MLLLMALGEAREKWQKGKPIQLQVLHGVMIKLDLLPENGYSDDDYDEYGEFILKASEIVA